MFRNTLRFLAVIGTSFIVSSCGEVADLDPSSDQLPQVENGRLSFNNADSYRLFLSSTIDENIEQIVHDLPGSFKSLRDHNNETGRGIALARSTDSDEEIEDELVWDPYFQNLLNPDREIKIDADIFRITPVGVFYYRGENNKSKMDSVQKAWEEKYLKNSSGRTNRIPCLGEPILIDDSINYLAGNDCSGFGGYYGGGWASTPPAVTPPGACGLSSNSHTNVGSASNIFGVNHTQTLNLTGTSDRRIKAKFWAQNYVIFSSAGTNTRSQNRWGGAWWAEKADRIYLKYEGEVEQKDAFGNYWSYPIQPRVEDKAAENKLSQTFQWTTAIVGNACDPISGKCKPKFKSASPFKIKKMKTCHFVSDEGRHGEISLIFQ